MSFKEEITQELIESAFTYKEALIALNVKVTHWNREKLKKIIQSKKYQLGGNTDRAGACGLLSKISTQQLKDIIQKSTNWSEAMRIIGYTSIRGSTMKTIQKYVRKNDIDVSHFIGKAAKGKLGHKSKPNDLLFVKESTVTNGVVRKRVIDQTLIPYCCAKCDNAGEWLGKPITLQLEHKNGCNNDNRLENLEFLCPNCHTQTPTWGRKKRI